MEQQHRIIEQGGTGCGAEGVVEHGGPDAGGWRDTGAEDPREHRSILPAGCGETVGGYGADEEERKEGGLQDHGTTE